MRVVAKPGTPRTSWIAEAKVYFVLSLSWGARGTGVRLVSEQAWTPVLFSLDEFDIVDARMPATWRLSRTGSLTVLEPEEWGGAFWESYFDGDPAAVRLMWKMADQMCDDLGDPHIERDYD